MRIRAGYAFGQFLPYGIVGAAVGRFNVTNSANVVVLQNNTPPAYSPPTEYDNKNGALTAGLVVGLGVDIAVLPNVFVRGEWEYVGFAAVSGIRANINTGRVAVGMKF